MNDPWLLLVTFKSQTAAEHAKSVLRELIDAPAVVAKRSEARAVLGEANPNAPKRYNQAALVEPVYNHSSGKWEISKDAL